MARHDGQLVLSVLGAPVVVPIRGCSRVQACRPPHVPVAKPGPCKGFTLPPAARKVKKKPFTITGDPQVMSAREFERKIPKARRLYRGVGTAAGAAATRRGQLGSGDYGQGIYTDARIGTGQSYTGRQGGVLMRMAVKPGAKVRVIPPGVRGSRRINDWADENGIDVVLTSRDGYRIVRNPAVLMIDGRDYTLRESVVLDYLDNGYTMPSGYEEEIAALRRDLGIEIPDGGQARR